MFTKFSSGKWRKFITHAFANIIFGLFAPLTLDVNLDSNFEVSLYNTLWNLIICQWYISGGREIWWERRSLFDFSKINDASKGPFWLYISSIHKSGTGEFGDFWQKFNSWHLFCLPPWEIRDKFEGEIWEEEETSWFRKILQNIPIRMTKVL